MAERAGNVAHLPARRVQEVAKRLDARGDALPQQLLRVGVHQRLHAAPDGFVAPALAELMKVRVSPRRRRDQSGSRAAQFPVDQQHGSARRTNRQRRDGGLDTAASQGCVAIQRFNGRFDQGATAFRAHHDRRADLPQLDHVRRLQDAVQQPQTGIRHVVHQTPVAQSQAVVDAAGRGGFQVVATDGPVDQRSDLAPVDPGSGNRQLAAGDARVAGQRSGFPETPFADPGHQFQPPLGQPQAAVQGLQTPFDFLTGDDLVRQRVTGGF